MTDDDFVPGAPSGVVMARTVAPTAERETTFAVIADPHVGVRSEGSAKLFHRSERHLRNAVADADARNVDAVLSVGDLTKDGEPWNYEAVDEVFSSLDCPVYAVPGNHDVPKSGDAHNTPSVAAFADRYAPGDAFPFHVEVGGVDVVGLNTAGEGEYLRDTHDGGLRPADRDDVRELLADLEAPIVLSHFNLPATFDQLRDHRDTVEPTMEIPPVTRDGQAYVDALAAGDLALLLTGHLHIPATSEQHGVRELVVPTTCSFPQAYLTVTVGPVGTVVRFHPVADRDGLRRAHTTRGRGSSTSRGLTAIAATRLARFPLVDAFDA